MGSSIPRRVISLTLEQHALLAERDWWEKAQKSLADVGAAMEQAEQYATSEAPAKRAVVLLVPVRPNMVARPPPGRGLSPLAAATRGCGQSIEDALR